MYAHPSFMRGRPEILSELKKCRSAADRKRQAKAHEQNPQSSAITIQEILPATMAAHINKTRAVSPSSSSDDDNYSTMRTISHTTAHHFYAPPPHFSASNIMHSSHSYHQPIAHSMCKEPLSPEKLSPVQPTRKLDLLTLAITCLDSANKSQV